MSSYRVKFSRYHALKGGETSGIVFFNCENFDEAYDQARIYMQGMKQLDEETIYRIAYIEDESSMSGKQCASVMTIWDEIVE